MAQSLRPAPGTLSTSTTKKSSVDPRMNAAARLDQRYDNFTFGPDQQYATDTGKRLQDYGSFAKVDATNAANMAAQQGLAAQQRGTPGAQYGAANNTLAGAGATAQDQGGLYNRLLAFADQEQGPSAAQAQLQSATDDAMAANLALAGSGRGMGDSAEAMRRAQFANAGAVSDAATSSAMLRAEEEQAHRQNILQAYGQGSDVLSQQGSLQLGTADQQAGMAEFATDAELRSRELNDQTGLGYMGLGLEARQMGTEAQLAYEQEARANLLAELEANMGYEDAVNAAADREVGLQNSREQRGFDRESQLIGAGLGAMSAMGGVMMMSDRDAKRGIKKTSLDDDFAALQEDNPYKLKVTGKGGYGALLGGLMSDRTSKRHIRLADLDEDYEALGG